jgi:hypothetical protein
MIRPWHCTLAVTATAATILVQDNNSDVLKARLHPRPSHPRALLTLLEGISLWHAQPLCVALSVADSCLPGQYSMLFGDELWPAESALVQFDIVHRVHPKRLVGVGDFRHIRKLAQQGGR